MSKWTIETVVYWKSFKAPNGDSYYDKYITKEFKVLNKVQKPTLSFSLLSF